MGIYLRLSFLIVFLAFTGCASVQQYQSLERRVAALEQKKAKDAMLLAQEAGARKFWWRNNLDTDSDSLSSIPVASLSDGDVCIVAAKSGTTMTLYFYVFDDDATDSESSPSIIEPNSGAGAWFLASVQVTSITGNATAGTHYIEVTNAGDLAAGSRSEGRCWYDTTNHVFKCIGSDGSTPDTIGP